MWNLQQFADDDYRKHLDVAFPADDVPERVSAAEKIEVLKFYKLYKKKRGRPSAELMGEGTRAGLRNSVHDAYDLVQGGKKLGALRSSLKLLAESCPYCGYGPVEELDHFLQRGQYKLYSIFPLNLVPCCATCNKGKRKIPAEDPKEHQVHVYLEDVTRYDFLRAEVSISPDTGGLLVRYYIKRTRGMPKDVHSRLICHLKEFDLQARYEKQANIFLGEQAYSFILSYENGGAADLKQYLDGNADALKTRFGANDWRTALMRGLAACPDFYAGGLYTALGR